MERGEPGGWWTDCQPDEAILNQLRNLLPLDRSWGDTEEYVSSGDFSSDVRIWREESQVADIQFRFSPVTDPWSLMSQFLSIARSLKCVVLENRSGLVLEPEEHVVKERFAASEAMSFLRDPEGTIVRAASDLGDDAG